MTNLDKEQIKTWREENKDKIYNFIDKKFIPNRYLECHKKNISQSLRNQINKAFQENQGIFLFGGAGTGKTYTLYCMIKELFFENSFPNNPGDGFENGDIRFCSFGLKIEKMVDLSLKIKNSFKDEKNIEDEVDYLCRCNYLFIDDFGAEKMTDFLFENIYKIIDRRYENGLPIYLSSNFSLKELAEKSGDRIASRIAEMCEIINMSGQDKRIK
jgi:DNA replication protein DnaC